MNQRRDASTSWSFPRGSSTSRSEHKPQNPWSSVWRLQIPNFTSCLYFEKLPLNLLLSVKTGVCCGSISCLVFLLQPRRLSFGGFGTLRKKRQDDGEEFVCPMNVEMPKSSSFQRGRVHIYEENLDHLEQVRTHTFFDAGFHLIRVSWPLIGCLLADGGLWGDSETDRSVFRGNQQSDGETSSGCCVIFIRVHLLRFLSVCFRACWRTTSSSRRSPSALLKSTTLFESLWFVGKPDPDLCGRTCETFLQPELSLIYWSCPAFISVFKYVFVFGEVNIRFCFEGRAPGLFVVRKVTSCLSWLWFAEGEWIQCVALTALKSRQQCIVLFFLALYNPETSMHGSLWNLGTQTDAQNTLTAFFNAVSTTPRFLHRHAWMSTQEVR